MPQYEVDVKAFAVIKVRADTPEEAVEVAEAFVENAMSANEYTVRGYNAGLDNPIGVVVPDSYCFGVDDGNQAEEDEQALVWENQYECPCGTSWVDQYACQVDDECPQCGKDISPSASREIGL